MVNRSWATSDVPSAWRRATIVPILKKDKPATEVGSYRPIALTSTIAKVAQRIFKDRLYWWLEAYDILWPRQSGFRKGHNTTDHVGCLCQLIHDGHQQPKPAFRTTAVLFDFQRAYS